MTARSRFRASRPAPVVASAVWRPAADRPAPEAARVPPLPEPLIGPEWHGTPWPLNEDEIDLPFPADESPEPPAGPAPPRWIGAVDVRVDHVAAPFPMDVLATPAGLQFGLARLDREQALRLCGLLLRGLQASDPWRAPT